MTKKSTKINLKDLRPNTDELIASSIKEELNKLFYLKPNYDAEMEMLKYQYDHEEEERLGLHASSVTDASKNFCFRNTMVDILYMEHIKKGRKIPQKFIDAFRAKANRDSGNPINLARIFEEGKSIGTKWQRLFIRGGIGVKEDMDVSRWKDEYDLSYTPDGIVTLNHRKYVVEIKSMNDNQFQQAKNHPKGRKQLKLYMHFEGIKDGFVLCDGKNNSDIKIFPVLNLKHDDEELQKSLGLLDEIQYYKTKTLQTKKLPKCTCGKCTI